VPVPPPSAAPPSPTAPEPAGFFDFREVPFSNLVPSDAPWQGYRRLDSRPWPINMVIGWGGGLVNLLTVPANAAAYVGELPREVGRAAGLSESELQGIEITWLVAGPGSLGKASGALARIGPYAEAKASQLWSAAGTRLTRLTRLPRRSTAYSTVFEVELPPHVWGRSHSVHRRIGQQQLNAMLALPQNAGLAAEIRRDQRLFKMDWHHATYEQGAIWRNGLRIPRGGVMQLVIRTQHSRWTRLLHRLGFGGYKEWAKPFGAPGARPLPSPLVTGPGGRVVLNPAAFVD
jgi:hypothetical protein